MINKLIFISFFTISTLTLAQENSEIRVNVFDQPTTTKKDENSKRAKSDLNYVYWNFYLLGRGVFSLGYERSLHPLHSIYFSVGPTYRDYFYQITSKEKLEQCFPAGTYAVTPGIGAYFDLGYKFYPKQNYDFDGFYISPMIRYRNYNYKISDYYLPNFNLNGSMNFVEYALIFGYCYESYLFDGLIIDFHGGVGYRQASVNGYTYDYLTNEGSAKDYYFENPALFLSYKVGIPF